MSNQWREDSVAWLALVRGVLHRIVFLMSAISTMVFDNPADIIYNNIILRNLSLHGDFFGIIFYFYFYILLK